MQTVFTAQRLRDPDAIGPSRILRARVQRGFPLFRATRGAEPAGQHLPATLSLIPARRVTPAIRTGADPSQGTGRTTVAWLAACALVPMLLTTPARAQTQSAQQQAQINKMLDGLRTAPSPAAAAALEGELQTLWVNQGSPSVRLLMSRGLREMGVGNYAQAVQSFDDVVTLDPNLAEGYRQLAMARYAAGDTQGAIEDLALAVQHEPRDFLAYKSLSEIAVQRGDWKGAYEAWQKLLALDPNTPGGHDKLKELQVKAFGQET